MKIQGHEYKVTVVTDLVKYRDRMGESCAGLLTIDIDAELPESHKEETLIHEIIEQLNFFFELELDHNVIKCLSTGWYQVIKDNPEIFSMQFPGTQDPPLIQLAKACSKGERNDGE